MENFSVIEGHEISDLEKIEKIRKLLKENDLFDRRLLRRIVEDDEYREYMSNPFPV